MFVLSEKEIVLISEKQKEFVIQRYGFDPMTIVDFLPNEYGLLAVNMAICFQSLYLRSLRLFSEISNIRKEKKDFESESQNKLDQFQIEIDELRLEINQIIEGQRILEKVNEETNMRLSKIEVLLSKSNIIMPKGKEEKIEILKPNIRIDKLNSKVIALTKTVCNYRQELKKKSRMNKKENEGIIKKIGKYNERLEDLSKFVSYSFREKEKIKKEKVHIFRTGKKSTDILSKVFFWRNSEMEPVFIE